jgi:hypothetical protein
MQNHLDAEIEENCHDIEHRFAQPGYGEIYGVILLVAGAIVWALIHFSH